MLPDARRQVNDAYFGYYRQFGRGPRRIEVGRRLMTRFESEVVANVRIEAPRGPEYCEYCGSLVIAPRCDACGAPKRSPFEKPRFLNFRDARVVVVGDGDEVIRVA